MAKRGICLECGKSRFISFGVCKTCKPLRQNKIKNKNNEKQKKYQRDYYEKVTKPKRDKEILPE